MFAKIKKVLSLPRQIEEFREELSVGLEESKKLNAIGTSNVEEARGLVQKVAQEFDEVRRVRGEVDALLSEQKKDALEAKKTYAALKDAEAELKELDKRALQGVRAEAAENQQTIQSMLKSTNEILRGVNDDRSQLERIRTSVDKTLATANDVLSKSEDAKRAAQALLSEAAAERGQLALVTDEQKMLAVMALNLCTVSVSKIIASGSNETMEQEYNAILNNLNLQVIPHDDALLAILRKLLDTITFFRLQEGDRKRLEARYNQRMNNLIWSSLSSVGGIFVMSSANPWAAAAGAAIMAGSMFVGYQRKKGETTQEFDEGTWKLERSAIEQLHALRASLFETAWRLSDSYGFKDEWRLTTRQIDWYNAICAESDHAVRYKKLEQYGDDFQMYPYYWYELGVAAQGVHQEMLQQANGKDKADHWRDLAEQHLKKFVDLDRGHNLLRQDVIGADARIRHVSLLAERKGWPLAIEEDQEDLECVKKLAVDDPELLLKAALVYAAGLRELCKEEKLSDQRANTKALCQEKAISYFEKLVYRGNNLPISSIVLSKLYLDTGRKEKYDELAHYAENQIEDAIKLVADDGTDQEKQKRLEREWDHFFTKRGHELFDLFERQFDIAKKLAHPTIFNGDPTAYPQRMDDFLRRSFDADQRNYKVDLFDFWEKLRCRINDELKYNEFVLGLDHDPLRQIANRINNMSYEKIAACSKEFLLIKTDAKKASTLLGRYIEIDSWLRNIANLYVNDMTDLATRSVRDGKNIKGHSAADINALLSSHIESLSFRHQLTPFSDGMPSGAKEVNYFGAFDFDFSGEAKGRGAHKECGTKEFPDGCVISFTELSGRHIDYFYEHQMSYTIQLEGASREDREKLLGIIKARYPRRLTSYRYDEDCVGRFKKATNLAGRWFEFASAKISGECDYVIQITDANIKVEYTRPTADEHKRAVHLLSQRAVLRELKRLGAEGVQSKDDQNRFKEVAVRWLREQKTRVDQESDAKSKNKVVKSIMKELRKMCKDPDARRLIAAYLGLDGVSIPYTVDVALLA